jgi:two-component system sensor histidine kinase/response regulator
MVALGLLFIAMSPETLLGGTVFNDAMQNSRDPLLSGVLVVSLVLLGGVIAFVAIPYMWEQSIGTRSLWQSVCRLERENQRLRRNEADRDHAAQKQAAPAPSEPKEILQPQSRYYFPLISHRFRSSMNSIMGHLQLLLDQEMTPDQETSIEIMYESAQRLMKSMEDVMDLSSIQVGDMVLQQQPFSVEETVDLAGISVGSAARDKNLELMCYPDSNIRVRPMGDGGRTRRILETLLGNAIRFTDHGTISLRSKLLKASETAITIRFIVEDTGTPLSDKDRSASLSGVISQKVEDRLQADSNGLEMVLAVQLLKMMGSRLETRDRANGGVRCSFDLNLPIESKRKIETPPFESLHGCRILLAEDNPETASFTKSLLASWGAEVDSADSQESLLMLLNQAKQEGKVYAVGLIDSQLNSASNIRIKESVLAACSSHKLPVILLSCRPDDDEVAAGQETAILEKPFTADRLNRTIQQTLSREQKPLLDIAAAAKKSDAADGGVRVLIVDDDRVSRELASRVLQRAGYYVQVAEDGLKALDLLQKTDFDLILMDLDMPLMDGFESTAQIRGKRQLADVPIIALTANALQDNAEKCRQAGMNDYITKPFQIDKLLKTLEQYLPLQKEREHSLTSKSDVD